MKITPTDLQILKDKLLPLDTEHRREMYRSGHFPRSEHCKDVNKRYRWDLLYVSGIKIGDGVGMQGDVNLYAYMTDAHIDTALRNLIPPL